MICFRGLTESWLWPFNSYYSDYFEVDHLEKRTASAVIKRISITYPTMVYVTSSRLRAVLHTIHKSHENLLHPMSLSLIATSVPNYPRSNGTGETYLQKVLDHFPCRDCAAKEPEHSCQLNQVSLNHSPAQETNFWEQGDCTCELQCIVYLPYTKEMQLQWYQMHKLKRGGHGFICCMHRRVDYISLKQKAT